MPTPNGAPKRGVEGIGVSAGGVQQLMKGVARRVVGEQRLHRRFGCRGRGELVQLALESEGRQLLPHAAPLQAIVGAGRVQALRGVTIQPGVPSIVQPERQWRRVAPQAFRRVEQGGLRRRHADTLPVGEEGR